MENRLTNKLTKQVLAWAAVVVLLIQPISLNANGCPCASSAAFFASATNVANCCSTGNSLTCQSDSGITQQVDESPVAAQCCDVAKECCTTLVDWCQSGCAASSAVRSSCDCGSGCPCAIRRPIPEPAPLPIDTSRSGALESFIVASLLFPPTVIPSNSQLVVRHSVNSIFVRSAQQTCVLLSRFLH